MKPYVHRPTPVVAARWLPGDMFAAGRLIAWVDSLRLDPRVPYGLGSYAVLSLRVGERSRVPTEDGTTVPVVPGAWVVARHDGTIAVLSDAEFVATYESIGES